MNSLSVCILLADGFEEAEAIIPADLLKRLGVKIIFAGVNSIDVRGTHNFHIKADNLIDNISSNDFDALILPGGLPGTINLRNSEKVHRAFQEDFLRMHFHIPEEVLNSTGFHFLKFAVHP